MCRISIYLSISVSKHLVLLGDNVGVNTHAKKNGRLYWAIVLHVNRVFLK